MDNSPPFSRTEVNQYLKRLELQINQKVRARLPKLELTQDQIAKLAMLAPGYEAEIEEIFNGRDFRPHPSVVRYIYLKAMNEAVPLMSKYPASSKTKEGRRGAVVARIEEGVNEVIKAFDAVFYDLTGEELLFCILTKPAEQAARLIDFSTLEQAGEMMRLLVMVRSGGRSAFYQLPKGDPRDGLDWLLQHLFVRYVQDPKVKEGAEPLTRQGTKVLIPISHASRKASSRGGKPIDATAPIHAQVLKQLGREINKHIRPVPDHGVSSIARSLRKDRSTIRRYLKEDLLLELAPDGKGEMDVSFPPETVFRSIETATPNKPGPKPRNAH